MTVPDKPSVTAFDERLNPSPDAEPKAVQWSAQAAFLADRMLQARKRREAASLLLARRAAQLMRGSDAES